jgi:hypothetical protein
MINKNKPIKLKENKLLKFEGYCNNKFEDKNKDNENENINGDDEDNNENEYNNNNINMEIDDNENDNDNENENEEIDINYNYNFNNISNNDNEIKKPLERIEGVINQKKSKKNNYENINLNYFCTSEGTIGVIIKLSKEVFEYLHFIQMEIIKNEIGPLKQDYEKWRSVKVKFYFYLLY